jgi:DNA-binding response OmpR family regulator
LSAGDNDQDRMRALAAGCADYDTKPIDLPRLRSKIEAAIARRQTPD